MGAVVKNLILGLLANSIFLGAVYAQNPQIPDGDLTSPAELDSLIGELEKQLPAGQIQGQLSTKVPCQVQAKYENELDKKTLSINITYTANPLEAAGEINFDLKPSERTVVLMFETGPTLTTIQVVKEFLVGPLNSVLATYLLYLRKDNEGRLTEVTIYNQRKVNAGNAIVSCQLNPRLN